jgi:hypothetical protein
VKEMGVELDITVTISEPLNFLGYARCSASERNLWSRDVESLFACNTSLDTVLSQVPESIKTAVHQYKDPFVALWPSFCKELAAYKERLKTIWSTTGNSVITLMDDLGIYYTGIIEVFPVMPFFREWARSNPLTIPALPLTDKEILELLVHEILHRTTEVDHPQSLWHTLSMVFFMKKIPHNKRFLLQHAFIYVASSWIASHTFAEAFTIPPLEHRDAYQKQRLLMEQYMHSLFDLFPPEKDQLTFAEKIVACAL